MLRTERLNIVAQVANLLFRRLAVGQRQAIGTACGLPIRDAADCQSALPTDAATVRRTEAYFRCQRGFSLLEVMVAVAVLAVAVTGLTRGLTTALGSSRDSAHYTQAVQLAENRLEFLRADGLFFDGETTGTEGAFTWRQTISTTATEGLHEVRVAVEREAGEPPIYELATLLYQTPSDRPASKADKESSRSQRNRGKSP